MSSYNVKHLASRDSRDFTTDFVFSARTGKTRRVLHVNFLNADRKETLEGSTFLNKFVSST